MVQLAKRDQEQFEKAKDLMETGQNDDLGFVRSLCFGQLRLDRVMPYPGHDPEQYTRTENMLSRLQPFLDEHVDADAIDAEERIADHVIRGLGDLGVLGMTVPERFGGGGFTHTSYCKVLEHVARTCSSTAVLIGAHQSIGLKALVLNGTEAQQQRFLPDLAAGRKLAAFALTEPNAGSDAANVQTVAHRSADGRHWVLNGDKKYITNGAIAGMMTVMARTPVEKNGKIKDKVTAFLVTPDTPGFEVVSPNSSKCGIRGTWQATLKFTDMAVPDDQILGELGRGLRVALTVLSYGRCTLSAGCVGGAKAALEMAVEHVRTRRQFDRSLSEFHLVKQKVARMAELTYAMDAVTYLTAGLVDRKEKDIMLETAICKLFCSEIGWRVIDDAVQLHGGLGYMRENGLERMLRDARINRIVEGATDVMISFVALMGLKGVGEELEQMMKAARHPFENFSSLRSFASRKFRAVVIGPSRTSLHPKLAVHGEALARLTRSLARGITRVLAKHREHILDRQIVQERIAWSLIEMYAMAAVMSKIQAMLDRATGDGSRLQIERDLSVGTSYCRRATMRIRRHLHDLHHNDDRQRLSVADAVLDAD